VPGRLVGKFFVASVQHAPWTDRCSGGHEGHASRLCIAAIVRAHPCITGNEFQDMYSGDPAQIAQAFKVKYNKDCKMVEDVRRNIIRAKTSEGFGVFIAFVNNN